MSTYEDDPSLLEAKAEYIYELLDDEFVANYPKIALKLFNIIIDMDPTNSHYRYFYGNFLKRMGKFEEAALEFELAHGTTDNKEEKIVISSPWADCLYQLKEYKRALPLFKKLAEKTPNYQTYGNLGKCFLAMTEYDPAEEYLQQAFRMKPDDVETLIALGNCLQKMNRPEEAKEYFEKAATEAQEASDYISLLITRFAFAEFYLTEGCHQEAMEQAQEAEKIASEFKKEELINRVRDLIWRIHESGSSPNPPGPQHPQL